MTSKKEGDSSIREKKSTELFLTGLCNLIKKIRSQVTQITKKQDALGAYILVPAHG